MNGFKINDEDKWIRNIAILSLIFVVGIILFCIPNWMKPSDEVGWLWSIPMTISGASIIVYFFHLIIRGL